MTVKRHACALAITLLATNARAGDCKIENIDGRSVQTCDNGYVETRERGHAQFYGIRNGGVTRYPGHWNPPWAFERRR